MKIIEEIDKFQDNWNKLVESGQMTIQAIRNLCIPFRDKYKLTDKQTLQIARREVNITQINEWIKGE